MKAAQFKGKLNMKQGASISVNLTVFLYEEDSIHYALCPALDILGYGKNEEEAKSSFQIMLSEILSDAISKGNLFSLLEFYGWHKNQPPKTSELIVRNRELAKLVDTRPYKTMQENISLPCA